VTFIRETLTAIATTPSVPSLPGLTVLGWQIRLLTNCAHRHLAVRKRVLLGFSAIKDDSLMKGFLSQKLDNVSCGSNKYCIATLAEARRDLGFVFTLLYLRTSILARSEESEVLGPLSLEILDKSQQLASKTFGCTVRLRAHESSNLQPIEKHCTSETIAERRNWKDQLSAHIQMEARCREDSLIHLVGNICNDLERRCSMAEEPFRKEEAKTQKLQRQVEELRDQKNCLQGQILEREMILESLETGKIRAEDSLKDVQLENEQLLARIGDSERKLRDATTTGQAEIDTLRANYDKEELDLRAELASKASIIEDQEMKLVEANERFTVLGLDVSSAKSCVSKIRSQLQSLEADLQHCRQGLETEEIAKKEAHDRIRTIENDKRILAHELKDTQQKHQESVSQFDSYRRECELQNEAFKGEIERLTSSHATTIEQMTHKLAKQATSHTSQLNGTITRLDNAKNELLKIRQENETNRTAISDQQDKVKQLEDIVAERDEEISEFQAMRETLAAAIGTKVPDRKHTHRSVHNAAALELAQHSPRHRSRRLLACSEDVQPYEDVDDDMADEGSRSFDSASSKSGPTPKRAKPRKSFKVPTIRQPRLSIAAARSTKVQDKRLPLLDVSTGRANISPVRPVMSRKSGNEKKNHENDDVRDLEEVVDLEFGSEVMFTSTPFTPKPAEPKAENGFYDDTTVDEG
jgi:hypothetical protein